VINIPIENIDCPPAEPPSGANLTLGTRRFGPVRHLGIDAERKLRLCKNQDSCEPDTNLSLP
jgi:hypothetical protein